jgi:hypothetical protein
MNVLPSDLLPITESSQLDSDYMGIQTDHLIYNLFSEKQRDDCCSNETKIYQNTVSTSIQKSKIFMHLHSKKQAAQFLLC